jgi:hypothetical protein
MHIVSSFHKKYLFQQFDMVIQFAVNVEFLYEPGTCSLMYLFDWDRKSLFHEVFNCHSFEFILVLVTLCYLQLLGQILDCLCTTDFRD